MRKASIKRKTIGLALGGGGARGLAHIGVIKALLEANIPIDYIAGTSMGALIGGIYAATHDIYSLESAFLKLRHRDILPLRTLLHKKDGALFKGSAIASLLEASADGIKIEALETPFRAVATDVRDGMEVVMKSGKLSDAIHASIAMPFVFPPVEREKKLLMDGGFSNPVPADVVRDMGADIVLAVDVSSQWLNFSNQKASIKGIYDAVSNILSVTEYQLARRVLESADIVLKPPVLNYGWLDFDRTAEIVDIGKDEGRLHLAEIRKQARLAEPPKTLADTFFEFLRGT
jgi:NTE family protein